MLPDVSPALTAQLHFYLGYSQEKLSVFTFNYESRSSEEAKELTKKGSCGKNLLPLPQRLEPPRKNPHTFISLTFLNSQNKE